MVDKNNAGRWVSYGLAGLFVLIAAVGAGCKERDRAGAEVRERGPETQGPEAAPVAPKGQPAAVTAEPIRDIEILIITVDRKSLLHRQVDLMGVEVQKLVNDRVFWIGTKADRVVPAYLDDTARASLQQAQKKLQKGEKVALVGDVRDTPTVAQMEQGWALSAGDAEQIARSPVYLQVRRIVTTAEGTVPQPKP